MGGYHRPGCEQGDRIPIAWAPENSPYKHRAVGDMIRKNKETDPPAARVAALTARFDPSGSQPFKLSSPRVARLSGEQLASKLSPRRLQERGHDTGETEQGEENEGEEREDHGEFAPPGSNGSR